MGHGRSSATGKVGAKRSGVVKSYAAGVSSFGMKVNGVAPKQNEALMVWGSDNEKRSFRQIINAQMNNEENTEMAKHADVLEKFIGNSSFKKDIWRGMSLTKEEFKALKAGKEWSGHNARNALSSWTESTGAAYEFASNNARTGKGSVPVLFVMTGGTKHGKSIAKHAEKTAQRGWEQEVLVSRRSKLKINHVSDRFQESFGSFHIVEVSEI